MARFNLTLVQTELIWENPELNLERFEKLIRSHHNRSDAILLPEMFATGFTMNSHKFAEEMDGKSVNWMKGFSYEIGAAIGGSLIIREEEKIFNRFVWVHPDGSIFHYDKRHLFFMERESKAYFTGNKRMVVNVNGLRILLAVCYDLRFPVWLRNRNDYDAIFLVANWPAARREVWQKLLFARAIENQCYVAAVNRIGTDGNDIPYSGESMVIDPKGNILHKAPENQEEVFTIELDMDELAVFRKKFPVWMDADDFDLKYL